MDQLPLYEGSSLQEKLQLAPRFEMAKVGMLSTTAIQREARTWHCGMIPIGIIMRSRITQAKSIQRRTYMGKHMAKGVPSLASSQYVSTARHEFDGFCRRHLHGFRQRLVR